MNNQRAKALTLGPHSSRSKLQSRGFTGFGLVLLCSACQSYQPKPLELAESRQAWHSSTLESLMQREPDLHGRLEEVLRQPAYGESNPSAFDWHDGLCLRELFALAQVLNPNLCLQRLQSAKALAAQANSGLWPDPEVSATVRRIAQDVPRRWILAPEWAFHLPLSNRLSVAKDQAQATVSLTELELLEAQWKLHHDVWLAFIEWFLAQRAREQCETYLSSLGALEARMAGLVDRGEITRSDALLVKVEAAQRRLECIQLEGKVAEAEQSLRGLVGLSPEAPFPLVDSLPVNAVFPSTAGGIELLAQQNPTLKRVAAAYELTEQSLRLEIEKQKPDLTLGPVWEIDGEQRSFGLLSAIRLPLFDRNRLAIAEAYAERDLAQAEVESTYKNLVGRFSEAQAREGSLGKQWATHEQQLLPLVSEQLDVAMERLRLGEGGGLHLLEALTVAFEAQHRSIELRRQWLLAQVELEHLSGPPSSPTLSTEVGPSSAANTPTEETNQ